MDIITFRRESKCPIKWVAVGLDRIVEINQYIRGIGLPLLWTLLHLEERPSALEKVAIGLDRIVKDNDHLQYQLCQASRYSRYTQPYVSRRSETNLSTRISFILHLISLDDIKNINF